MPWKTLRPTTHTPAKESEDPSHPPALACDGHPESPQWKEEPGTFVTTCILGDPTQCHQTPQGRRLSPPPTRNQETKSPGESAWTSTSAGSVMGLCPFFCPGSARKKKKKTVKIYSLIKMQSLIIEGKNVQLWIENYPSHQEQEDRGWKNER